MTDQTTPAPPAKKNKAGHWLAWWMIDADELAVQVAGYSTLKLHQSARGICLLLFIFSAVLTTVVIEAVTHDRSGYIEAIVFLGLGVLIQQGQRWAMIAAMVLWTLEKVAQLAMMAGGHAPNPIMQIVFWCIYMHALWLAFRVEQERRKPAADPAVFS